MSARVLEPGVGRLLVKRDVPDEKTPGGIIKPISVLERETGLQDSETPHVIVVAVGEGVTACKAGDTVLLDGTGRITEVVLPPEYPASTENGRNKPLFGIVKNEQVAAVIR